MKKHKLLYFLLFLIFGTALFWRLYRIDQLLGFYYDQGRDALVIWRFWHNGDLFLIGPTTGIEGIFRGPWYYWLIAPFYLLGGGSPVWPDVFLVVLSVAAIVLLVYLAILTQGYPAGVLAGVIASLSFYLVIGSQWLSNPTPMFIISMLLILFMFLVIEDKKWAWLGIFGILGLSMQFGSAAEVFYFPAILVFTIWQRKNLPTFKIGAMSLLIFFLIFLPQIVFDIRNKSILSQAIIRFLFEEKSFSVSFWGVLQARLFLYANLFFSKILLLDRSWWAPLLVGLFVSILFNIRSLFGNRRFLTILLIFFSPLIGMLFFQGNLGNVYDYYFTSSYLVFVLLFSILAARLAERKIGIVLVSVFLLTFLQNNLSTLTRYVNSRFNQHTHIALWSQLAAVDWVLADSQGQEFNVDVYVPPVVPYAYDYLFLWQGNKNCGIKLCGMSLEHQAPLLYTLYEIDPPHPERLEAWLVRQQNIGAIETNQTFGGITIERRQRIK